MFTSAFLLFFIQPLIAKMLLPRYGGSPAVWNTAMVFFQVLLLAGYLYAHVSLRWLGVRRQAALHVLVLLLPLVSLPPVVHAGLLAPPTAWPVPWVLASLALAVGLPFLVLATNSSLVQRWYVLAQPDGSGGDPYWLYAASNVGSLLALLAYPFLLEPLWGIQTQARIWAAGYVLFVVLAMGVMFVALRRPLRNGGPEAVPATNRIDRTDGADEADSAILMPGTDGTDPPRQSAPITWRRRAGWVLRAATATSLLMAITLQFTTDVAAVPLFWLVPLAVYLATFILAFGTSFAHTRRYVAAVAVVGTAALLLLAVIGSTVPLAVYALVALLTLFAGALVCHADLAADRPGSEHLTDFYLWLAAGGAVGGILNSLVAPLVFSSIAEYPITLAVLAWLLEKHAQEDRPISPVRARVTRLVAAMLVLAMLGATVARLTGSSALVWVVVPAAVVLVGLALARLPRVFPLAATLVALFLVAELQRHDAVIAQSRSFFGVLRVREDSQARYLVHGTTNHGGELKDPALRLTPITYHYRNGPLGSLVAAQGPDATIAVTGLGAGSLAGLGKAGQHMIFYEIDPLVEDMARRYFHYLAESPAATRVVLGDARLTLADAPDGGYDLMVMDAFSSDAIPIHLVTDEAVAMYLRKLRPGGILLFNISNRYLDLTPLFRGLANHQHLFAATSYVQPAPADARLGALRVRAAALTTSEATYRRLLGSSGIWQALGPGRSILWTDDYSNLVGLINWTGEPAGGR